MNVDDTTRRDRKDKIVGSTVHRIGAAGLHFEQTWDGEFSGKIDVRGREGEKLFTVGFAFLPDRIDGYVEEHRRRKARRTDFHQGYAATTDNRRAGQVFSDAVTRQVGENYRPPEPDSDVLAQRISALIERDGAGAAEAIATAIIAAAPSEVAIAVTDALGDPQLAP